MTEFEAIEPTDLLKKIRSGEVANNDPAVLVARNFAYFLRPHLEGLVGDLQRQTRDGATLAGGIEELIEIAKTGLQLAVEHQIDMLDTTVPMTEQAASE